MQRRHDTQGHQGTDKTERDLHIPIGQELRLQLDRESAIRPYVAAAQTALDLGLDINAGHDLSLDNLPYFKQRIPQLAEVSIGHQLISDALYLGLEATIQAYQNCLR
ncbi:MAG: pyridoxine 5'-phosphate synthase [Muribaculaceae bacterium]|nr:pyridoxine 5'-phosphate synthase [Muribaculaceae bacterium]MBR1725415.1 pyridoxine 5'-phosphate synthase [Muribaculaceae bacterium]